MGEFTLTGQQQVAKDLADQGKSIFITGSGGVGKSVVVRELVDKDTILVAPTGVAAINIGGVTCHSFFRLPIGVVVQSDYLDIPKKLQELLNPATNVKRIVFDEAGMIRSDMLDLIDHRLRTIRHSSKPFGGLQVIFVGDFFQLEPIVSKEEKETFFKRYDTAFCFGSKAWQELNPVPILLSKVMRQDDTHQVDLLNALRTGSDGCSNAIQEINHMAEEDPMDELTLCTLRKNAETINRYEYRMLKGTEETYQAIVKGQFKSSDYPVEAELKLKEGALVIFCANDTNQPQQFFNGERGRVKTVYPNGVIVEKENGDEVEVGYRAWDKYDYDTDDKGHVKRKSVGSFEQIPLLLGYAITIHKSQGMTLDAYNLDMGWGAFSHGQTYVALSRAKDLTKVHLVNPIRPKDIIIHEDVKKFYEEIAA